MKIKLNKFAVMTVILSLSVFACACSNQDVKGPTPVPVSEISSETEGNFSAVALYEEIAKNVSLPEMYVADDDYILNYYGIDTSKLQDYVFESCIDPTRTDTVILIRLKDVADAEEVTGSLNLLLEQMEAEMANYNPAANELVQSAAVRQNGTWIDLVICENLDTALSLIDHSIQ